MRIQFDPGSSRNKWPFGAVPVHQEILFRITVSARPGEEPPREGSLLVRRDGQEDVQRIVGAWEPAKGNPESFQGKEVRQFERCEACKPEGLASGQDGETGAWESERMTPGQGEETEVWEAERMDGREGGSFVFRYTGKESGLYFYRFYVSFEQGGTEEGPEFQLTLYDRDYETPDWLSKGLMYQIFPDRFAKSADYIPPPQNKRYTLRTDWGGLPNGQPDSSGTVWNDDFFGGNLKGITQRLDQLADLGVTVLYLNPIFSAFSNHRYDTADYLHIDPMLGTEEDLKELCGEAALRGIRILLDGVFNHTGCDSIYFNKYGRFPQTGACQSPESPYFSWYTFTDYPNQYECWWGINTLPAVKKTEPSYVEYMLTGPDSVIRHWMRCGVCGFRLDVADELPDSFLDTLRQVVKEENPEAAIIGEVWEDASNKISYGNRRRYLQGKQLDSVMNYPVKDGIIRFLLGHSSARDLQQLLESLQEHYPKPAFSCLMNILGTHDTARIFTVLAGQDQAEEAPWGKREERREKGRSRLFLALLIWAFLPGIPCIYYGDELGMEGGRDPQNRGCYSFENRDRSVYAFYRRLLCFRMKVQGLEHMELSFGQAGDRDERLEEGFGQVNGKPRRQENPDHLKQENPGILKQGNSDQVERENSDQMEQESPAHLKQENCFQFSRIGRDGRLMVLVNPGNQEAALCPELSDEESLMDFLTAGRVDFSDLTTFHLSPGAGAALWIAKKPR